MYKIGDKIILWHNMTEGNKPVETIIGFDPEGDLITVDENGKPSGHFIDEDYYILEEIYNSPLYKALNET